MPAHYVIFSVSGLENKPKKKANRLKNKKNELDMPESAFRAQPEDNTFFWKAKSSKNLLKPGADYITLENDARKWKIV